MKSQKRVLSLTIVLIMLLSSFTALSINAASTGSQVYFDNSVYNWEQVYVYAYDSKGNTCTSTKNYVVGTGKKIMLF